MALTNAQENSIIRLFVTAITSCKNSEQMKKVIFEFEADFGNLVAGWKDKTKQVLVERNVSQELLEMWGQVVEKNEVVHSIDYEIRMIEDQDYIQIKEILKNELNVFMFEEKTLKKFANSKYSYVACNGDQVLGVLLAGPVSKLFHDEIWIEILAVAGNLQGNGIGKSLFEHICSVASEEKKYSVKLCTERNRTAYHIYKHWGMKETQGVYLEKDCY